MDFRTLSRRELQALCKRNKIPANITNAAMADALAALPFVEGIEEFVNGEGSGVPESPMREEVVSSEIPRTALRASRRKAVKDEPTTTRTRRAAVAKCTEESASRDLDVALITPSLRNSRRRMASASSACKKVDFPITVDVVEKEDEDLDQEKDVAEKTPAVPRSQKKVAAASARNKGATEQRVYSTRRSVRLLEKNMESLSLGQEKKMEPITVHMSFDEMPNSSESVKEDVNLEIEAKKTDESEGKLADNLELEIDDQEKNEMESEVKLSVFEPKMDMDSFTYSAENFAAAMNCDDSETKVEDEEANEASKDDEAVEISTEEINDSDKISLPSEDLDLTEEVRNPSIVEESGMELESKQNESTCELECVTEEVSEELMNISSHENVEEETQVDVVLSSIEESVMELKDTQNEHAYESESTMEETEEETEEEEEEELLYADNEGEDKKEMVSENFVDVKIQKEEAPEDINVDAIDSQPIIPNHGIHCEEEEEAALVEVSVTSTEETTIPSSGAVQMALANQFPRPTVEAKSSFKDQAISRLVDNSDADEEEEEEKANCIQKQNDLSLRQLRKTFKEKLQLSKKKLDTNNSTTKVVGGGGKVRTALQPLPENRMAMEELEKGF